MKHFFESYILVQQDILTSKEAITKFLSLPVIIDFCSELQDDFYSEESGSLFKWNKLSDVLESRAPKEVIF